MRRTFILWFFFGFTEHREVPVCWSKLWACYKAQGNGDEIFFFVCLFLVAMTPSMSSVKGVRDVQGELLFLRG